MSAQSYTQSQPQPMPVTPPSFGSYGPSKPYLGLIIVGILLLMVGGIIFISAGFIGRDMDDYSNIIRIITTVGNLILFIGIILLSIGLVNGAIKDDSLHPNVRLGMLIALGLIIGIKLSTFVTYYLTY